MNSEKPCRKELQELHDTCFQHWKQNWNDCNTLFQTFQKCMRQQQQEQKYPMSNYNNDSTK